jgi:hypothetical protein
MTKLVIGEPVEVNKIIASNAWPLPPTKVWTSGYTLEGIIDDTAVVKQVGSGLFEGCLINYALEDVRAL